MSLFGTFCNKKNATSKEFYSFEIQIQKFGKNPKQKIHVFNRSDNSTSFREIFLKQSTYIKAIWLHAFDYMHTYSEIIITKINFRYQSEVRLSFLYVSLI